MMTNQHKNRSPWKYFLLTFAYSWVIWIPSVLDGIGIELPFIVTGYSIVVVIIGAFAPMMAAITLVFREEGWKGTRVFLGQALNFRIKPVYLVLALALPVLIHAIAHYLALAVGLDVAKTLIPTEIPVAPIVLAIPTFILMLVIGGGQEEFGWRGYAQEPLQEKIGVIPASLVIGVIWGIWHLPLWFMAGDLHGAYSFLAFVMMTTSISIVYAWLYNSSGKKLIVVIFFHAMSNTAAPLLPFLHGIEGKPESAYWIYAAVNVIFGIIFAYVLIKGSKPTQR
jgi:membrane protease YdiL (CAAX protease family)